MWKKKLAACAARTLRALAPSLSVSVLAKQAAWLAVENAAEAGLQQAWHWLTS